MTCVVADVEGFVALGCFSQRGVDRRLVGVVVAIGFAWVLLELCHCGLCLCPCGHGQENEEQDGNSLFHGLLFYILLPSSLGEGWG